MCINKKKCDGLSLIEMLVVIVIVSMVSVLLIQGLGGALSLYDRVRNNQQRLNYQSMGQTWFRTTVAGVVSNRLHLQRFQGSPAQVEFVTLRPLLSAEGVPTQVRWIIDLDNQGRLIYQEGGEQFSLSVESSQNRKFQFLDAQGHWQERWPFERDGTSLPMGVAVVDEQGSLTALIGADREAIFHIDEIEFGG